MSRYLYIECSPRKQRSHSTALAEHFLAHAASDQSGNFVDRLDLWAKALPEFDQTLLDAKYAVLHGQAQSAAQKTAWAQLVQLSDRVKAADRYVISVPMWNFSIPYKLKHYLDLIMQPGLTFGYSAERGYFGLLENKKALLVLASGGAYEPGTPGEHIDYQSRYLRFVLNFMGVQDVHELRIAPTLAQEPAAVESAKQAALAQAAALAERF
jgi:FMN-dependent NADH-azoreductase